MIGLVYLLVMGGHLLLSIWVVKIAIKEAGKYGKPGWYYGLPVGIVMFSLLYWDLIPTHAVHRYYCLVDGGFMVNKTLEEWKRENPGVAETLVPNNEPGAIITGNRRRYILNQRFVWDVYTTHHAFGVKGRDERIVDMKNDNVLAKYIDFDTDIRALGLGTKNFRDMRVWLMARSCEVGELMSKKIQFNDYFSAIKKSGRMQNGNK